MQLKKASTLALRDFMGLVEEETLLVISDENMREIGLALYESGQKLGGEAYYFEMPVGKVSGEEPPEPVGEMMKTVDVVVIPTTHSYTHTKARRQATKLGVRVGTMPGITPDTMVRCFNADYERIVETTDKLTELLRRTNEVHVTTDLGTDITISLRGRRVVGSSGVMRKIASSGNLPSGEVSFAPIEDKTNGIIVFDGAMGGMATIENPVTVEIEDGKAVKFSGSGGEARVLSRLINRYGDYGKVLAEYGIGTNYKAEITGEILEDQKILGMSHFGFGNNLMLGGKNKVPIHIDGVVKDATVYADGKLIVDRGEAVFI
ncbi:MAG: aminopeptidase [Candidatus Kapaibacterium sp.]